MLKIAGKISYAFLWDLCATTGLLSLVAASKEKTASALYSTCNDGDRRARINGNLPSPRQPFSRAVKFPLSFAMIHCKHFYSASCLQRRYEDVTNGEAQIRRGSAIEPGENSKIRGAKEEKSAFLAFLT